MADEPRLIPQPWAAQVYQGAIPNETSATGRASWAAGFPPETALPLGAGGVPPHWLDFQGVLNALSAHIVFAQCGGRYAWSRSLDYPVGACILGSDGIAYQAIQASGPGTAAGAKDPASAANPAYWGQIAAPDGSTIKLVDGKLSVDGSATAALLADGTTIVSRSNKLSIGATATAALLADGTTITASNGKLTAVGGGGGGGDAPSLVDNVTTVANGGKITVDLSSVTPAALKKISQYLALSDGGLTMDATTGKLAVDFSGMTEAAVEAVLKSLHIQIALTANKRIYVATNDPNAADTTTDRPEDEGRGTETKPFKTIQAAVTWAAQTYSVGRYAIRFYIKPGTYQEAITLPDFTRTTGFMTLRADDYEDPPVLIPPTPTTAGELPHIISCAGGRWNVSRLIIQGTRQAQNNGLYHYPSAVRVYGGTLDMIGCAVSESFSGAADTMGVLMRPFAVEGDSTLRFSPLVIRTQGQPTKNYRMSIVVQQGNAQGCEVFNVSSGGRFLMYSTTDTEADMDVSVAGQYSCFATVMTQGLFNLVGGQPNEPAFVVPSGSTATGKRYEVSTGAGISVLASLPGDTVGTVDSTTCGWYKQVYSD